MSAKLSLRSVFLFGLAAAAALSLPSWLAGRWYAGRILTPADAPPKPVAIVFGAGLYHGRPSGVLADRIVTAVSLYQAGKVEQILMSGADLGAGRDEPAAMRDLALQLGVPLEDVLVDPGGDRTYSTCARAQRDFGVTDALLVTQRFHLPRALVICDALGIDALGVSADLRPYRAIQYGFWQVREIPATLVALWEAFVQAPDVPATPSSDLREASVGRDHGSIRRS